jgi:hypothetical protein
MQKKRGRPRLAPGRETEQVTIRLPKMMLQFLRGDRSAQIRERLAGSLADDDRDPNVRKLQAQIEQLAKEVQLACDGREWHADRYAHAIFVEAVRLLLADLPAPESGEARFKIDPSQAAGMLYTRYVNDLRQLEQHRMINPRSRISLTEPSPQPIKTGKRK